jgi:hypothetical protein
MVIGRVSLGIRFQFTKGRAVWRGQEQPKKLQRGEIREREELSSPTLQQNKLFTQWGLHPLSLGGTQARVKWERRVILQGEQIVGRESGTHSLWRILKSPVASPGTCMSTHRPPTDHQIPPSS